MANLSLALCALQRHTQTLFCSASEFAVCLVQDHWWQLPSAPPGAPVSQFLPFPSKLKIMVSLKVCNSSVFLMRSHVIPQVIPHSAVSAEALCQWRFSSSESHGVVGGVFPCTFQMSVNMSPSSGLSCILFTLQVFSNFINKLSLNPWFMQITDKSSCPLQAQMDRWRHLGTIGLSQI